MSPMKSLRQVAAVLSSLGLVIGCVLFKQKQANPALMPSSKSLDNLITSSDSPKRSQAIMPGSKSGVLTISADAWKVQTTKADKP